MEEQLIYTTFSPLVIELLADLKQVVQKRGAYFRELRVLETEEAKKAAEEKMILQRSGRKRKSCRRVPDTNDNGRRDLPAICDELTKTVGISIDPSGATVSSVRRALADDLKANLEAHIIDVDEVREAIIEDIRISDGVLEQLGESLQRLTRGITERRYEVITKCTKDGCPEQLKSIMPITSDHYIHEIPFKESWYAKEAMGNDALVVPEGLESKEYIRDCPECGSLLDATAAMNIVYPRGRELIKDASVCDAIYAIITRVKSSGRYVDKLVDLLFYDPEDPDMKKRSISDKYAFTIVLNNPNGMSEAEFRRMYRNQFDINLTEGCDIGDAACYALLSKLARHFGIPGRAPVVRNVQDDIKNPQPRTGPNGIEYYKRLQLNLYFGKMVFEGQIKTKDIWDKELSKTSAISHWTWEETERELRDGTYMKHPEALVVRDALRRIFPQNNISGYAR